ncbi:MAG: hypothetical protein KGO53_11355 [Alphaproteobacteria bacterium]|nr:hypothetical protein [Alphaproteobacteria bacterium]
MRIIASAICYFAIVFAAGFVLGTLRTLWVAPYMGPLAATLLELPFMLAASWAACGFTLRRFALPAQPAVRLATGLLALALLLAAEATLSVLLGGLSLKQHIALYQTAPVLLGLAGQAAFAAFPLLRP